jgi:hypothetical protein
MSQQVRVIYIYSEYNRGAGESPKNASPVRVSLVCVLDPSVVQLRPSLSIVPPSSGQTTGTSCVQVPDVQSRLWDSLGQLCATHEFRTPCPSCWTDRQTSNRETRSGVDISRQLCPSTQSFIDARSRQTTPYGERGARYSKRYGALSVYKLNFNFSKKLKIF